MSQASNTQRGKIRPDKMFRAILDDPAVSTRFNSLNTPNYELLVFWTRNAFRHAHRVFSHDTPESNLKNLVSCAVKALQLLLPKENVVGFLVGLAHKVNVETEVNNTNTTSTDPK